MKKKSKKMRYSRVPGLVDKATLGQVRQLIVHIICFEPMKVNAMHTNVGRELIHKDGSNRRLYRYKGLLFTICQMKRVNFEKHGAPPNDKLDEMIQKSEKHGGYLATYYAWMRGDSILEIIPLGQQVRPAIKLWNDAVRAATSITFHPKRKESS